MMSSAAGPGIDELVHGDEVAQLQVPGHSLADVPQQEIGVGLAVAQESADLVMQRIQTGRGPPAGCRVRVDGQGQAQFAASVPGSSLRS